MTISIFQKIMMKMMNNKIEWSEWKSKKMIKNNRKIQEHLKVPIQELGEKSCNPKWVLKYLILRENKFSMALDLQHQYKYSRLKP